MALKNSCPTLAKVRPDEDIFVLRAQDHTAPLAVLHWITLNFLHAPEDKLMEAFRCALRMRAWKHRKLAD